MDEDIRRELQALNVNVAALRSEVGVRLSAVEAEVKDHSPRIRKVERAWARIAAVTAACATVGGVVGRFLPL